MKFHRVIGKIDPALVEDARARLSKVFLDLGLSPNNEFTGSAMGGDPLIFCLLHPMQHIATTHIPTAATDGVRYYWNPRFVMNKSRIGLRIVSSHEAWHAIYMHPSRRGSRLPGLWNIAVDFIVNWTIMCDLKSRKLDPVVTFQNELGNFATLEQYAAFIKNPFEKIPNSDHWTVTMPSDKGFEDMEAGIQKNYSEQDIMSEKILTDKEIEEEKKKEEKVRHFFADPDLPVDMRKPERIYDYLLSLMPKCPECGKRGYYKNPNPPPPKDPNENPEQSDCDKGDQPSDKSGDKPGSGEQPGQGQPGDEYGDGTSDQSGNGPADGQSGGGCPSCGKDGGCGTCGGCDGFDPFGWGDTLDDHMDASDSPEKMAKRLADGIEAAKRMAGKIPGELEDEIGKLLAPQIKWQDEIRAKLNKTRDGNAKNDYTRYRTRPLFAGLMIPKKISKIANFICLLDTSGSMSKDDMTFGVSQLQSIDQYSEGTIVPADAVIYWDKATRIRKVTADEIQRIKIVGRGGTLYSSLFTEYKQKIGDTDFIIVITDGFLDMQDIASMVNPGIPVYWIITSKHDFVAPFGRTMMLR